MAKTLITGARGFIGRALTSSLVATGEEVVCLNRTASPQKNFANQENVEQCVGDVTDTQSLTAAMQGVDVVYHLAAVFATRNLAASQAVNVAGTRNVAVAAAQQKNPPTLIYVSSLAAAGPGEQPAVETADRHPVSNYGKSKREAEAVLKTFASQLPISIVRPPCVFGQGDQNMLPLFQSVQKGWNVVVSKTSQYSFVHVDDVVAGMQAATAQGKRLLGPADTAQQGVYYLTDSQPVTFVELADQIATVLQQTRVRHIQIPRAACWLLATGCEAWMRISGKTTFLNYDKLREGFAGSWTCDASRAKEELNFSTPKSLAERLQETIEHCYEQKLLR